MSPRGWGRSGVMITWSKVGCSTSSRHHRRTPLVGPKQTVEIAAGTRLHPAVGMGPYASAIAELAESPEDLSEIEEEDVDALLREEHVPKLKARRFRRALRELGANVNAQ